MFTKPDGYLIRRRDAGLAGRLCESGLAHDNLRDGYQCRSVKHVKYGPYTNTYTKATVFFDLEDQAPLKCRSDYFRFDDGKGCIYLEQNEKLHPKKVELPNFQSPFFKSIFMLNGQSLYNNCQCNSDPREDSYCIPIANYLWKRLHDLFKNRIADKIKHVHADFHMRYDMWLHDANSTIEIQDVEDFSRLVTDIQKSYMRDWKYKQCIRLISPFIQLPFADPKNNYTVKHVEEPIYVRTFTGARALAATTATIILNLIIVTISLIN